MRLELSKVENQQACLKQGFCQSGLLKRFSALVTLLLFSSVLLSGCGFHLRGYGTPQEALFKTVKLSGLEGVTQEVQLALRDQFEARGVVIMPSLVDAELDIKLQRTYTHSSKTSYTGSGDVASVLLTLKQSFMVEEVATEKLLLSGETVAYRDHKIDNIALLASNRELQEIKQQMANEVVSQLVERINRRLQASQ